MFVLLGLIVVVAFVIVIARRRDRGELLTVAPRVDERVVALTARWVEQGLITPVQAEAIVAAETRAPTPAAPEESRVPLLVEAVGYVGALLAFVAAGLVVAPYWPDWPLGVRIGITAVGALGFWFAGMSVPEASGSAKRLRALLWVLSTGTAAYFSGLVTAEGMDLRSELVVLTIGVGVAGESFAMWRREERPAQHLTTVVGLAMVAGSSAALVWSSQGPVGVAIWLVGAAWLLLTWRAWVPQQLEGYALGAAATLIGSLVVGGGWGDAGPVVGLATALALGGLGIVLREALLSGFGLAGLVVFLPATLTRFFADTLGVPLVLLVTGVALVGYALGVFRHQGHGGPPPARPGRPGRLRPA